MLNGRLVTLREIRRSDLPVMHREFRSDVPTWSLTNVDPWRPVSLARLEAQFDRRLTEDDDPRHVRFAVQERGDERGELIEAAYVMGERIDDITYGLLRREWQPDDAEE